MNYFAGWLRRLDAYNKPLEDFRIKTLAGGAVTIASAVIIVLLIFSEFFDYFRSEIREELFVDTSSDSERLKINFDIVFHALPCPFISVDAMDVSGEHQDDLQHDVWKISLDPHGDPIENSHQKQEVGKKTVRSADSPSSQSTLSSCGSCYGAESRIQKCCNTCDDVKRAYKRKGWSFNTLAKIQQCNVESWIEQMNAKKGEGCRVYGSIGVSKVAGNFHIAPGKSIVENHMHVHDLRGLSPTNFNASNTIVHLSFGEPYPTKMFPLDGHVSVDLTGASMFQFYAKCVSTLYVPLRKNSISSHQFSITKHRKTILPDRGDGLPGLFFIYEFSPIMIRITEENKSLTHFLTSLCAIVGGVFTVASIIDILLYNTDRFIRNKADIGKAS